MNALRPLPHVAVTSIEVAEERSGRLLAAVSRRSIVGEAEHRGRRLRNRLLKNFFLNIYGILDHTEVDLLNDLGASVTVNFAGDVAYGKPAQLPCLDTELVPFNAHLCAHPVGGSDGYKRYWGAVEGYSCYEKDGAWWMEYERTQPAAGHSSMLFFNEKIVGGVGNAIPVSHVLVDFKAYEVVKHRIGFRQPWLRNWVELLFALSLNSDIGEITDVSGTTFTPKGAHNPFASRAWLAVGTSNRAFSYSDYDLENRIDLRTVVYNLTTNEYAEILLHSVFMPSKDIDVGEVGALIKALDSAGNEHTVLIARQPLPTVIRLRKDMAYVIRFRIVYVP